MQIINHTGSKKRLINIQNSLNILLNDAIITGR